MQTRNTYRALLASALAVVLFVAPAAFAQQGQQAAQQDPSAQAQGQQDREPLETFKVDVNIVNVFFNAKTKKGLLVPSLTKDDFEIFEDGKPQTIKYYSAESNQPLTLGMLIDTSGSQAAVLQMEQEVGAQFLRQVLREKDLAFLMSFDVNVELLQDYTNAGEDLRAGLRRTRINTGGGHSGIPGMGGGPIPTGNPRGTLLHDAIFLAADEKLKSEVGRKAMIVLTDGMDQGSRMSLRDAIEASHRSDAMVYVLLIADEDIYARASMGYTGDGDMKKLAEETGGRLIRVGSDEKKLREAFEQISNELRSQYSIGYTPTNQKKDGAFRKVELKAKNDDIKVQVRKGYFAPKAD